MWRPATCKERSRARKPWSCASARNKLTQRRKGAKNSDSTNGAAMKRFGIVVVIGAVLGYGAAVSSQEKKDGTPGVVVDKDKRTISIDAKIAPRKLPHLKEIYPLEVIACWPHPKGKKAHETVVTIDAKPSDVHKALESLGLKAGKPVM